MTQAGPNKREKPFFVASSNAKSDPERKSSMPWSGMHVELFQLTPPPAQSGVDINGKFVLTPKVMVPSSEGLSRDLALAAEKLLLGRRKVIGEGGPDAGVDIACALQRESVAPTRQDSATHPPAQIAPAAKKQYWIHYTASKQVWIRQPDGGMLGRWAPSTNVDLGPFNSIGSATRTIRCGHDRGGANLIFAPHEALEALPIGAARVLAQTVEPISIQEVFTLIVREPSE
jgi:hypothetical protein